MRKIVSRHKRKKIQRRNQFIVGFILVFLMVSSTIGFAFQGGQGGGTVNNEEGGEGTVNYNGFSFDYFNGFWIWGNFVFKNLPDEVPEVGGKLKNLDNYRDKIVYVQSENEGAESEIIVNLGPIASKVESVKVRDVGNCEENFIIIEENAETEIVQNGNCVFIHGSAENLIKLTDQFLFKIIGIK